MLGKDGLANPLKVLATLQTNIPARFLQSHFIEHPQTGFTKREVILSLYLAGDE